MTGRLLFGSTFVGLVAVIGVSLVIVFFLSTENGSRWIIRNILVTVPGEITINRIEGTLTGRIELIGIEYKDPSQRISINTFSLAWQPSALLKGTVLLKSIVVRGVDFRVGQNPPESTDEQQFNPAMLKEPPIKLIVQQLLIEDIRVTTGDKVHKIQKIQVAAFYDLDKVHIDSLSLEAQPLSARINAQFLLDSNLPFELGIDWKLSPLGQPQWKGSSQAKGNRNSIAINNFDLSSENGDVQITGMVSWNETPSLSLAINAHDFDPVVFMPELPGRLTLDSHVKGHWLNEKIWGEVDIKSLKGQLRGYPLSVYGQFDISEQRVTSKNLHISSANNSIILNGTAGKTDANIDFSVDAPALIALWPTLSGELKGKGYFQGEYAKPNLLVKIDGHNLRMGNHSADTLSFEADYRSDPSKNSNAHMVGLGIEFNGNQIDTLNLKGEGSLVDHQWDAKLVSPIGMIDTHIKGSATGNAWDGDIDRLELDGHEWGTWKLKNPTRIAFAQEENEFVITSDKSCLVHKDAMFCVQLQHPENGGLYVDAEARSIPLTLAKQKLPRNMDVKGTLDAKGWIRYEKQGLTGSFEIALPNGATFSMNLGDEPKQLSIGHSTLIGSYDKDTIKSRFDLTLPNGDGLLGDLQIGSGKPRPISGQIIAEIDRLSLFDPFVPDFAPLSGTLNADLAISGNVDHPIAKGEILLADAATDLRRLGIKLHGIHLQALTQDFDSTSIAFKGHAQSGDGQLELDGSLRMDAGGGWPIEMNLAGTDFELARLPEAQILISPDLRFVRSKSSQKITGTITIPKAELTLGELPESAIAPSQDEFIVGERTKPIKHRYPSMDANLSVTLGKDVSFSGQGLKTNLSGKVDIKKTGERIRMHGRIALKNARYRAYGQDLNVRRGEILFNGPADNPWLDIEAVRLSKSKDVTVVLRVTGPAKAPQTRISSTPPLPETEALAYLLTGRALNRASRSEANMIGNAALSYGIGQLSGLTEKLGIDEFEVQEDETLQDTFVSVGKYLTPDFYVGTSVGIFNRSPDLVLKHRLTDEFSVETYSGESHRIELKYEFDVE